jgi:citrate synthase
MTEIQLKSQRPYSPGLEGIVAGLTAISEIDPKTEHLTYRGYDIHDLVKHSSFEEVAYILLMGSLPKKKEIEAFVQQIKESRELPAPLLEVIRHYPKSAHPMDMLRTNASFLGMCDSEAANNTHEGNLQKTIRLVSKFPTIVAACYRVSKGLEVIPPNPKFSQAKDFLYMVSGKEPDDYSVHIFDRTLILYAEHGFNASTFSARVTSSTLSDLHSAITSAIGTLKGPLHGGANEEAMKMLLEIKDPLHAKAWIQDALAKKKRVMGFGHREYKNGDPRAKILKPLAKELCQRLKQPKWSEISEILEEVMVKEKGLYPNVDFPSAIVYYLLGLPMELYTPIFAVARVAGWSAHVIEQLDNNRLIRPECEYTGSRNLEYIPMEKR